ncbi:MAG: hypothetical protein ABMB14_05865 [Myxococcota bacterium]
MLIWLVAGCGGADPVPTYRADVEPIMAGRCVGCHTPGGIGTFPLDTYADVVEVGEVVGAVTSSRSMPPWKAAAGHQTYANDPSLTDDQIATIAAWVEGGMPEGDAADAGAPIASLATTLPRVDVTLSLPEPYLPALSPDDYRCFVLPWTAPGMSYVTGFDVHPGNSSIVHHVAAYLIRPDGIAGDGVIDTFTGWDGSEGQGPGYTCFGGPSKTGEALDVPVQQVAQWVPGSGATLFPDGVGIPVPEGSLIVLQMHYNTLSADGNPDQSTLDLMTTTDVERIGAFAPWLDAGWTFGNMEIPPDAAVTHTAKGDPLPFFDLLLDDIDLSNGFLIHAAMLHMHNVGTGGLIRLDRADGTAETLLDVPAWDFDWQLTYQLAEPIPFAPDDELYLECRFDNPTSELINWGEGSGEEMCVANLFVSAPK